MAPASAAGLFVTAHGDFVHEESPTGGASISVGGMNVHLTRYMPTRREWLTMGVLAGLAETLAGTQVGPVSAPRRPAVLGPDDGELVFVGRDPVRIKVSGHGERERFGMITQEVSPGTSIPVHLHEREDEIIFIQSGIGEGIVADDRVSLVPGSVMFVPQGTWHGGRNTGPDTLRWIAIYSPAGFEGYFREIGRRSPDSPRPSRSREEAEALDRSYGIRYR